MIPLIVFFSLLLATTSFSEAESYLPRFSFKKHIDNKEYIFDREQPIAQVSRSSISLYSIVFRPGGNVVMTACPMYWLFIGPMELLELNIEGENTNCMVIHLRSRDIEKRVIDHRRITITYSPDLKSYVYRQDCLLTVTGNSLVTNVLEFSDPNFTDFTPGPAVPTPEAFNKRWQKYVYEAPDGKVYFVPHNHNLGNIRSGIQLKHGGLIVAVFEPEFGNPAIELLDDTAERTQIDMCHWGYDLNFKLKLDSKTGHTSRVKQGTQYRANFQVFQYPANKAKDLAEKAIPRPSSIEYETRWHLPKLSYLSTFSDLMGIYDCVDGDIDPWQWYPWHKDWTMGNWDSKSKTGLVLERSFGRTDNYCLKIKADWKRDISWNAFSFGPSFGLMGGWPKGKVYRISGYIKTKNVIFGRGSAIVAQYWGPKPGPRFDSMRLKGTNDWTKVSITLAPPLPHYYRLDIQLRQDAAWGTTWFDDVEIEAVDQPNKPSI